MQSAHRVKPLSGAGKCCKGTSCTWICVMVLMVAEGGNCSWYLQTVAG
jgi:hypothetical protein